MSNRDRDCDGMQSLIPDHHYSSLFTNKSKY